MSAARAGIAGRAINKRLLRLPIFTAKAKNQDPRKQLRFFLPFIWETCVGVLVGGVIVAGGVAMCTVGYYADHFSTTNTTNGTHVLTSIMDRNKAHHLSALTFVGPVFMGIGCFIIVVAWVVVLETRDKIVKDIVSAQTKQAPKKLDFYDQIIDQMKSPEEEQKSLENGIVNKAFEEGEEDLEMVASQIPKKKKTKTPRKYSTIEPVLKRIPMEIFAINMDNVPDRNSLLEVKVNKPATRGHTLPALDVSSQRARRPTLEEIFHHRESTPDPARRVLSRSHVPPDDPGELLPPRAPPAALMALFSGPTLPKPLYPPGGAPEVYGGTSEVLGGASEVLGGASVVLGGASEVLGGSSEVFKEGATHTAVNVEVPEEGASVDVVDRVSGVNSVVVVIHEASLTRTTSDSSLSSTREEQVASCVFDSDSSSAAGDITPRPPRKDQRRNRKRKSPSLLLLKSDSRATLSAVQATVSGTGNHGESSNSDDDSLHLTAEMMQHFDMSPAGTPEVSCPGTAEISFASETTANTLDTAATSDTHDISGAGTAELSFTSVSTANPLDTSSGSRPTTPEVPLGATMNTRRRGVSSINDRQVDVV